MCGSLEEALLPPTTLSRSRCFRLGGIIRAGSYSAGYVVFNQVAAVHMFQSLHTYSPWNLQHFTSRGSGSLHQITLSLGFQLMLTLC